MKKSIVSAMTVFATVFSPAWICGQTIMSLPAQDRPLRAEVTPIFTIGGSAQTGWAAFARIDAAAFDAKGNLYLLDAPGNRVVVVRPDGRLLREMGRAGGGPGEFSFPGAMGVLADGRVVVADILKRRLIVFGPDGEFLTDVASAQGEGVPGSLMGSADAVIGDVRLYTSSGTLQTRTARGMQATQDRPIQRYSIVRDDSRILHRARASVRPSDERGQPRLSAFFHEFAMTVMGDGRAVISDTGAYHLTVVRADGGVERVISRPLEEHSVTDRHRRAERQRLLDNLEEGQLPQAVASVGAQRLTRAEIEERFRHSIEAMAFPTTFPQITALRTDAMGRIWVARTSGTPGVAGPIDILTADGTYVGTLPAADPGLPMAFGPGGVAAYVETDSLDVPVVRVARIRIRP